MNNISPLSWDNASNVFTAKWQPPLLHHRETPHVYRNYALGGRTWSPRKFNDIPCQTNGVNGDSFCEVESKNVCEFILRLLFSGLTFVSLVRRGKPLQTSSQSFDEYYASHCRMPFRINVKVIKTQRGFAGWAHKHFMSFWKWYIYAILLSPVYSMYISLFLPQHYLPSHRHRCWRVPFHTIAAPYRCVTKSKHFTAWIYLELESW